MKDEVGQFTFSESKRTAKVGVFFVKGKGNCEIFRLL